MTNRPTVLVVDDEAPIRELLTQVLEMLPINIVTSENGEEALKLVTSGRFAFDAILSDIKMPKMDGLTFLLNLRRKENHTPFVILTAYGDKKFAIDALRHGAFDFLEKPFRSEELIKTMEKAIRLGVRLRGLDSEIDAIVKAKGVSADELPELRAVVKHVMLLQKEVAEIKKRAS